MNIEKQSAPALLEKGIIDRYLQTHPEWADADALWVYGSYYNGNWSFGKSDIDLIRIKSGTEGMERTNDVFETIPVNTYSISTETLEADAKNAASGFWYINRLLVPHHFLADKGGHKEHIWGLVTEFLEQYAFPEVFRDGKALTIDEMIARTYLVQLDDFPHYAVGFASIFRDLNFAQPREQFTAFAKKSSSIIKSGDLYSYQGHASGENRAFYHERLRLLRWEAHRRSRRDGMEPDFVEKYLMRIEREAEEKRHEIENLLSFLRKEANLT